MINVVQLLCDLSEASEEFFRVDAIGHDCNGFRLLTRLGAVGAGPRLDSITCLACDADHSAVVEFDEKRKCYVHFCPEAGLVTVSDAELSTARFDPEWLVDWLSNALHISPRIRRPALVPNRAWHLGDAVCGDTQVTVVFARRVVSQADLDRLASALRPVHPAEVGLVLTTSFHVARQVQLPGRYQVLPLPEIIMATSDGLVLDNRRLGLWIRGIQPTTAKGAPTRAGRPSPQARVAEIFQQRRGRRLPVTSDAAEARAILDEWNQHAPDQDPPSHATVRRHVSRLTKKGASQ